MWLLWRWWTCRLLEHKQNWRANLERKLVMFNMMVIVIIFLTFYPLCSGECDLGWCISECFAVHTTNITLPFLFHLSKKLP